MESEKKVKQISKRRKKLYKESSLSDCWRFWRDGALGFFPQQHDEHRNGYVPREHKSQRKKYDRYCDGWKPRVHRFVHFFVFYTYVKVYLLIKNRAGIIGEKQMIFMPQDKRSETPAVLLTRRKKGKLFEIVLQKCDTSPNIHIAVFCWHRCICQTPNLYAKTALEHTHFSPW